MTAPLMAWLALLFALGSLGSMCLTAGRQARRGARWPLVAIGVGVAVLLLGQLCVALLTR